jgi:methionyl-tRNA formyltransferase
MPYGLLERIGLGRSLGEERPDGGLVGGRELVALELVRVDEAGVLHRQAAHLAALERAGVEVEIDGVAAVLVADEADELAHLRAHAEPLPELSVERGVVGLALLHAPPGELPEEREHRLGPSLRDEVAPALADERRHHAYQRLIDLHQPLYITAMRFSYVGLPLGALALVRAGFVPRAVCVWHLDAPGMRRLRRVLPRETLLLGRPDLRDASVQHAMLSRAPEALLSFFWPKLIPVELLEAHPRGAFGTHPSLLPRHRGPDPFFWTILEGDPVTGVTLHRLSGEYDTGAIVDVRRIDVPHEINAWGLARALDRPALELLVSAATRLSEGEALQGTPQPLVGATEAPTPRLWEQSIDWREPAERVVRRIRASAPYPGCVAQLGETTVVVARARLTSGPGGFEPAEAFVDGSAVKVRAGDGFVELLEVRDLEERRVDPAALFAGTSQDS